MRPSWSAAAAPDGYPTTGSPASVRRLAAGRVHVYPQAVAAFKLAFGAKSPWIQLRTTKPIESIFAIVRHRTTVTKGPGTKAAGLAMAFKLNVALGGAAFEKGRLVERPVLDAGAEAA